MSSLVDKIAEKTDEEFIQKILQGLVKIDTTEETDQAVNYLKDELNALGISSKIIPTELPGHSCLVADYGDKQKNKDCVIAGHLDTVPIGEKSQWNFPPLSAKIENGVLYGRGSVDMKAGIAAAIGCLATLAQQDYLDLTHRIVFMGTSDEEITMLGAKTLSESNLLDNTDFLIIPEPTSLQIGTCEKGVYWVIVNIKGKAAHGSMPHLGISAIEAACRAITSVQSIMPKEKHSLLGFSTFNCGTIQGGLKTNIVPDTCKMDWDFRLVPNVNILQFKNNLNQALKKEKKATISYNIGQELPAMETNPNHPYINSLMHWAAVYSKDPDKKRPIGLSYATDAAMMLSYPKKRNIPFAIIGPGAPGVAHQVDEHVNLKEVFLAAKIYTSSLIDLFKGD
ncbi:MAG: M20 family metallopeptidase [Candidatus Hermodarchaeota archaeon]